MRTHLEVVRRLGQVKVAVMVGLGAAFLHVAVVLAPSPWSRGARARQPSPLLLTRGRVADAPGTAAMMI
jgi:hypothetical protein